MTVAQISDLANHALRAARRDELVEAGSDYVSLGSNTRILLISVHTSIDPKLRLFPERDNVWWTATLEGQVPKDLYVGINPYEAVRAAVMSLVGRTVDEALEDWSLEVGEEE